MKQLFTVATIAVLAAAATLSLAADGAPGKGREEYKARLEQWCKDNPEKCRELKEKADKRREWCKANPEKCKEELQARREQWSKDNPEQCRELKEKGEQRREQRPKQQG